MNMNATPPPSPRHRGVPRLAWVTCTALAACFVAGLGTSTALADHGEDAEPDAASCHLYDPVEPEVLLRRLTLDLQQRVPTIEEYEALEGSDALPSETLDTLIASDAFREWSRRFHMDLLWGNVSNVQLDTGNVKLNPSTFPGGDTVWRATSSGRRTKYRGVDAICQDKPQTDIEPGYVLGAVPQCEQVGDGCLDGWVEMVPYWHTAAQGTVKVCAFEAQVALEGINSNNNQTVACNGRGPNASAECGCGPNLQWCYTNDMEKRVLAAMQEQLLLAVDRATVEGQPYTSLLTTPISQTNGVLQFWRKHLAPMANLSKAYSDWAPGDAALPENPDANDATWVTVQRGAQHSGILTEHAYSLRFQTNRARANRFRIIFEGQYFQPPSVEEGGDCAVDDPDITERCTCRQCHQVLEPLAAAFSQTALAGSGLIDSFEPYREDCIGSNSISCTRFYETKEDGVRPGWLRRLQYADDKTPTHSAILANINSGLPALTEPVIANGTFARSMVIHLWTHFMGRPPILDPLDPNEELDQIDALAKQLREDDDFQSIVRAIVSLDQYRRSR